MTIGKPNEHLNISYQLEFKLIFDWLIFLSFICKPWTETT